MLEKILDKMEDFISDNSYWNEEKGKYIDNIKGKIVWVIYSIIIGIQTQIERLRWKFVSDEHKENIIKFFE